MDNLTHTAVGLFLSRAGLNRWTPRASAILIVAANIPDLDTVSLFGGAESYLRYHRYLTHSLIALPVMAALSVLLVRLFGRRPLPWLWAWLAAMIGVASHLALDYTNGYGIRLLLPFSPDYYRLEWTNVVDLVIWAALLLGLAAPFLARLVGSEIASGSFRTKYPARGWPIFALAFVTLYICARGVLHARAAGELESRVYQDAPPLRVAASPAAGNPLRWRGIAETADLYAVCDINLARDFDPTAARIFHKVPTDAAIDAARRTPPFTTFLRFAQFPLWSSAPSPEGENALAVSVTDMRFMGWGATAVVDARGRVLRAALSMGSIRLR